MKTLFVSDLDGTLLNDGVKTSAYTNAVINGLVDKGMLFSYATARSFQTAHKVTAGLNAKIPLIIYNGTMVVDNADGSFLLQNFFGADIRALLKDLLVHHIYPIVYSLINKEEKFSYIPGKCTQGMQRFIKTRQYDMRRNCVASERELFNGDIFYITCIGEEDILAPFFDKYKKWYHCVFQADLYTGDQWLEIMPLNASKSNAAKQLKELYGCDRLVAFGDGKNDIDLFEAADEAYAVANAMPELKAVATGIIESNIHDGVARWLCAHYRPDEQDYTTVL